MVKKARARKALIIVDVQNDFVEGGSLAVAGGKALAQKIVDEILKDDHGYDFIGTTQDWHIDPGSHFSDEPNYVTTWPVHCVAESEGAAIVDVLQDRLHALESNGFVPGDVERIFKGQYEDAYSGFMGKNKWDDGLAEILNESDIDIVHVVGIAAEHCVAETALSAAEAGFKTVVLRDFTVGIDPSRIEERFGQEFKTAGIAVK